MGFTYGDRRNTHKLNILKKVLGEFIIKSVYPIHLTSSSPTDMIIHPVK
jgi:hypothetical protein